MSQHRYHVTALDVAYDENEYRILSNSYMPVIAKSTASIRNDLEA